MPGLRFLFVGRFSQSPQGARITVSGERMADVMARLDLRAAVEIPDQLGSQPTRRFELPLGSARALRVADVCASLEPLAGLGEIAKALAKPQGAIGLADAIAKVRALVGDGPLVHALSALDAPAPAASTPPPAASTPPPAPAPASGSAIDAIFGQADIAAPDTVAAARSGLDAFIAAMRKNKPGAPTKPTTTTQRASALILDAIEAVASDALAHEPAAAMEAGWRGIKLVLGESPGHEKLAIELLDLPHPSADAIRDALERAPADVVFVVDAPADLADLAALGAAGESQRTPIVASLDPALLDGGRSPLSAWAALRGDAATQWLCAATNDVVVASEDTRVGARVVFGSPVFAIAGMLAASLRRDGTFGDAFGRAGALVGPASWSAPAERGASRNLPVRAHLVVDAMRTMVDAGVTVLGSEPGGERILAVGAPMVAKADGPALAGRALIGRAARAAIAAKDSLAHGAGPSELAAALARAATGVLPDGAPGSCTLRGQAEGSDLAITAEFRADAVGRAFTASFRV
jgi:hypothetical protein